MLIYKQIGTKQILKGLELEKFISSNPLNKGYSLFGLGTVRHIESVAMADKFLINQNINLTSIDSKLLEEACSACLIGGP